MSVCSKPFATLWKIGSVPHSFLKKMEFYRNLSYFYAFDNNSFSHSHSTRLYKVMIFKETIVHSRFFLCFRGNKSYPKPMYDWCDTIYYYIAGVTKFMKLTTNSIRNEHKRLFPTLTYLQYDNGHKNRIIHSVTKEETKTKENTHTRISVNIIILQFQLNQTKTDRER